MSIGDAAVEAAAKTVADKYDGRITDDDMELARAALEAAAPHLMAAAIREASERVGKRYAHLHQMRQDELMAKAWLIGYMAGELDGALGANGHEPPDVRNPYGPAGDSTFADRMARQSIDAVQHESWRAKQ